MHPPTIHPCARSRHGGRSGVAAALLLLALAGCAAAAAGPVPGVVRPGAPGEESRVVASAVPGSAQATAHSAADVRFMQDMIAHHLQAVEMTALVEARTERADIRRLARRIEASQDDEIAVMRRWLEVRGEAVPGPHAHHGHGGHAPMPGMLSAEEIARLAAARGAEFDRLFLESMIRHHEGALVMVADLFATDGAGQEPEIFQFAAHVDSDQRIEIGRMQQMLAAGR
jgi:uncharacterized protein (DUF305 family)